MKFQELKIPCVLCLTLADCFAGYFNLSSKSYCVLVGRTVAAMLAVGKVGYRLKNSLVLSTSGAQLLEI